MELNKLRNAAWRTDRRAEFDEDRALIARQVPVLCELAELLAKRECWHPPRAVTELLRKLEGEPPAPVRDTVTVLSCPDCPWEYRGPHWSDEGQALYRDHFRRAHRDRS